jgi:hypothetical protein
MAKSTGKQHRGDAMHIETVKKDKFASPGMHAGDKEHHIGPGLCGADEYEDGGETQNEECEHD